jgi:hypothetical protein
VRHLTAWRTATNCRSARIDALIDELRRAAASRSTRRAA